MRSTNTCKMRCDYHRKIFNENFRADNLINFKNQRKQITSLFLDFVAESEIY